MMGSQTNPWTRRDFLRRTTLATSFVYLSPQILGRGAQAAANDRLNIAFIGVGGRGGHNLKKMDKENIVALCDVDEERAEKNFNKYEDTPKYKDYRVMLDKHGDVDAVVVSTPDHTHAVAAMAAIQRGKHVYVEKPLAHSIQEVRLLMQAARENKVQTQLGNQGHSSHPIRKVCEYIQSGVLGNVREVHAWYKNSYGNGKGCPEDKPEIPETLEWDLWLGPAPYRPYHPEYVPRSWRSWSSFGTGVLGDWVCHILDPAFWALKLTTPTKIKAMNEDNDFSFERFPQTAVIEYNFPAREEMPPVKVSWTYGRSFEHPLLEEIELDDWNQSAGALIIGEKTSLVHGSHGAGNLKVLPLSKADTIPEPEQTIPRVEGGHHQDWIRACKEGTHASSHFPYGGPLTEVALLGVIATFHDEQELCWDSEKMKFSNLTELGVADCFLHFDCREGWDL